MSAEAVREVRCSDCGGRYELSARRARDVRAGRVRPLCPVCRGVDLVGEPEEEDYEFWRRFPPDELERLIDAMASLGP